MPADGLLKMLGSPKFEELDRRLRDRIALEKLRKETETDLTELKEAAAWLAQHSGLSAPDDLDADSLSEFAKQAREKEREAAAHFLPVIAELKSALNPPLEAFDAEVQRLLRDSIEVLEGWFAFFQGLSAMLVRQAEERRTSPKILRAPPVAGEVDYAQLSREHIARYPKIRARLAE
jgi:hypothetical protein